MSNRSVAPKPRNRTVRPDPRDVLVPGPLTNDQAAVEADQTSSDADLVAATADIAASGRDGAAADREVGATARDAAAAARDRAAEELEIAQRPGGPEYEAAIKHAGEVRIRAAADRDLAAADRKEAADDRAEATLDRGRAAKDREHAAMDREHAAMDRRQAQVELERTNSDDLTGAYRRRTGEMVLQGELDRARRSGGGLVLAFVDVDGLRATNNQEGHAAGDARLREVVSAMRSKIRSYEPIVRHGGDEFLCSFAGVSIADVRARFDEIKLVLKDRDHSGSISVGLAELQADDTLQDLINRADETLIDGRGRSGRRTLRRSL
jgi:diguanylate cyclase (GGDEF)-like protein